MVDPVVHFVGFRGDEYVRARQIWRGSAIIHRWWDRRARREVGPDDVVIFASGDEHQPVSERNAPDLIEPDDFKGGRGEALPRSTD